MMHVLITGAAGFIGSHFVEHFRNQPHSQFKNCKLSVIDKLTYAANGMDRLKEFRDTIDIYTADFSEPLSEGLVKELKDVTHIIHMGGETHVDRSIDNPELFVKSNVMGTANMLRFARQIEPVHFYFFSTDEVFGPAPDNILYSEGDPHNPTNPYAASKSAAEMLVKATAHTYGLPCTITRTMNVFGERQHAEKFIPTVIRKVLNGETVSIHSDKYKKRAGSRFYIYAYDVVEAYLHIMDDGLDGTYHIVGRREVDNLELAKMIAEVVGKPLKYEMVDFHSSRPGHDLRYALNGTHLHSCGWSARNDLPGMIDRTVNWYLENPEWIKSS